MWALRHWKGTLKTACSVTDSSRPEVNCILNNHVWEGKASLICKMSIMIEVFPKINVTVTCRLFTEHFRSNGLCIWKQSFCGLFFFSFFMNALTAAAQYKLHVKFKRAETQKLVEIALTHHWTASYETLAKHYLRGNTDRPKRKLIKLQSSAV